MAELAIHGGEPVRTQPWPSYNTLDEAERRAVNEVLDSGVLSQFLGTWSPDFFGGPRVQKLERAWESHFGVRHAVSMNSATSCLYAAVGAAGIAPGDEVIVSPYTMAASATAALVYGGIPVFADIDPISFCISADTIRPKITAKTKAIIVVDLFGHPADFAPIMALAKEHNLIVIEDCAQAPGATYQGQAAGTLAHMGVYSLNYHKTIHCGEGGVVVTNDANLAERLRLIRNHGEVVAKNKGVENISNLIGFNYRMTEIEAAIAYEQLQKLDDLVAARQKAARFLDEQLSGVTGLTVGLKRPNCTHGYYVYPMLYDATTTGMSRADFVAAVCAEGVPLRAAYVEPIYMLPIYQQRIAFGQAGYPFNLAEEYICYQKGICPVVESMYEEKLILGDFCHSSVNTDDLNDVILAIKKVALKNNLEA